VGPYQQLHDNPRNLFVATFLGTPPINLFAGTVVDHHWQGNLFGGFPIRADLPNGTRVIMGVRPAALHTAAEGAPARVQVVTPFYSERYQVVELVVGEEQCQMIAALDQPFLPGEEVVIGFNANEQMYFDVPAGERIG
jgi:ABC-type sugar transport system ATPase subunit